ncbi:M48 family metallopeptidase [Sandaracinobacter neustonicus]|uniref:M48 family metallopeptidase n=2 Tax=Sandaracinobacter neustonicus TaxID=1715348 RepID=A0A501XES7_9SPHN|nr:M48 family metallopeptidase [Sandaracinobacter neustonicus]
MSLRLCTASRSVKLTLPPRASLAQARAFVASHQGWIEAQAARRLPQPLPFVPGALLPVAGEPLRLMPGSGRIARRDGDTLLVPGEGPLFAARTQRWLKAESLRLLDSETRSIAALIGREVKEVRVADPRSRWGSCAADGRIAYSWRLILAPDFVRRSVVAHEVAHLAEMNHSVRFWRLATQLLGEPHDKARNWLRANGPLLLSYGVADGGGLAERV